MHLFLAVHALVGAGRDRGVGAEVVAGRKSIAGLVGVPARPGQRRSEIPPTTHLSRPIFLEPSEHRGRHLRERERRETGGKSAAPVSGTAAGERLGLNPKNRRLFRTDKARLIPGGCTITTHSATIVTVPLTALETWMTGRVKILYVRGSVCREAVTTRGEASAVARSEGHDNTGSGTNKAAEIVEGSVTSRSSVSS